MHLWHYLAVCDPYGIVVAVMASDDNALPDYVVAVLVTDFFVVMIDVFCRVNGGSSHAPLVIRYVSCLEILNHDLFSSPWIGL